MTVSRRQRTFGCGAISVAMGISDRLSVREVRYRPSFWPYYCLHRTILFEEGFGQRAMLGAVDLIDWADEGDLERTAVRILPVVGKFISNPGLMRRILGSALSGRLRAFIEGQNLTVETLRNLHSDLIRASVPPSAESADIASARFNAKHHSLGYSAQPGSFGSSSMNVLVFASRKGGSGKSTLAAHLAAHVHKPRAPVSSLTAIRRVRLRYGISCAGMIHCRSRVRSGALPNSSRQRSATVWSGYSSTQHRTCPLVLQTRFAVPRLPSFPAGLGCSI